MMRRGTMAGTATGVMLSMVIFCWSIGSTHSAVGASQPAGSRTVHVDEAGVHYVGKLRVRRGLKATTNLRAARAALGRPALQRSLNDAELCRVRWRHLGMSADFRRSIHVGGDRPCEPLFYFDRARLGQGWRTSRGLKVGSPTRAIRRAYPDAKLVKGKWELVTVDAPFSGEREWLLAAITRSGRVETLLATVGELD